MLQNRHIQSTIGCTNVSSAECFPAIRHIRAVINRHPVICFNLVPNLINGDSSCRGDNQSRGTIHGGTFHGRGRGSVMMDMDSNSSSSWWKEIERMPPYTFQDSYQEGFVFKMVRMHISGRSYVLQGFIEKSWSRLPRFPILHWNTGFELEASKVWWISACIWQPPLCALFYVVFNV